MPVRDGTGPVNKGAGTGRGMGGCVGAPASGRTTAFGNGQQRRAGRGGMKGRGLGRGVLDSYPAAAQKAALEQQRDTLRVRLDQVDEQLKNL